MEMGVGSEGWKVGQWSEPVVAYSVVAYSVVAYREYRELGERLRAQGAL
jgi:hypothetical protein